MMQRIFTVSWLTWKAAFRFRLFWVLATLLVAAVVLLPLLLKHDGTARGFTQILLTYTLTTITALLGLATLWIACATLARDIEECQIQLVCVKPISRWQVWLGKWLGITSLNLVLLAISGTCVYALLQWRAQQLPEDQRRILFNEVLVARGSLKEKPPDIEADTERVLQRRLSEMPGNTANLQMVRDQIREQVKSYHQVVRPNRLRRWTVDLGFRAASLREAPLFLRVKFYAASTNALGTYELDLQAGPVNSPTRWARPVRLAANTYHEFQLPPNLLDAQGALTVDIANRDRVALLFPLEDALEVLYREGGFALNFGRGLGIIWCWLALLASLGLAASSLLSFPVATFVSASLLVVGFSTGTLAGAVEAGTVGEVNEETGAINRSPLDYVLIPFFRLLLQIFNVVQQFSPIDALSTGRSVSWGHLGVAAAEVVLLMGGLLALAGIFFFTRRELATAQGTV